VAQVDFCVSDRLIISRRWLATTAPWARPAPLACLGNPDPVDMKVYAPAGEETFDDIQTTEEAQAGADRREAA
jgi:hypothetical protein